MAKKKCVCDCQKCLPAWLAAFGDLMSLLLCFFVLLLSMSTMDAKKVSDAIGSLSGALSVLEGGTQAEVSPDRLKQATPIERREETADEVNRVAQAVIEIKEMTQGGGGPAVTVEEAEEGFFIRLPANLLFKPGSARIENQDAILFLKRIALIIMQFPNNIEISVRGHTDDQPPAPKSPFKDNWELSSARSISVLQELHLAGVEPKRTSTAGFAKYRPVTTNATKEGRAKNRRVDIYFFGTQKAAGDGAQQSVLDSGMTSVKEK